MSFRATLLKAIQASANVHVGIGLTMQSVQGMYGNDGPTFMLCTDCNALEVGDQEIEVDDNGCAIFVDTDGFKHALVLMVHRALAFEDLEQEEELANG